MRKALNLLRSFFLKDFARRISMTYSVLLAVMALFLCSATTMLYTQYNEATIADYSRSVTDTILQYTDTYYEDIIEMYTNVIYSTPMQDLIRSSSPYPFERESILCLDNLPQFSNFRTQITNQHLGLKQLYLFSAQQERVLYYAQGLVNREITNLVYDGAYKNTPWYQEAQRSSGEFLHFFADDQNGIIEYFVRQIRDVRNGREIGTILLALDPSAFLSQCTQFKLKQEDVIAVLGEGDWISHASDEDDADIIRQLQEHTAQDLEEFIVNGKDGRYNATAVKSKRFGWTICYCYSLAAFDESALNLILSICISAIALLSIFVLLSVYLSRSLSRPIMALKSAMHEVEHGNYRVHIPTRTEGDLDNLNASFNNMTNKLNQSIEEAYISKLQKQDAQILTMQTQIHPHFLYNAINSIQMNAILNKDYQTSRMLAQLGTLLRYIMSFDHDVVTLREEMEIVRQYIQFRTMKETSSVALHVDIPEELLDEKCLKMAIQPIVENCFRHGDILHAEFPQIRIRAKETENGYIVTIGNNGRVIDPEQIAQVNRNLESVTDLNSIEGHIGLANVHLRLKLYYGKNSGIRINQDGEWTIVEMRAEVHEVLSCGK